MSRLTTLEIEGILYGLFTKSAHSWRPYLDLGLSVEARRDMAGQMYQCAVFQRLPKLLETLCLDSNN